jgi:hypothetical protein
MAECTFCGSFVGENQDDDGVPGFTIGEKDICMQCLAELKQRLEMVDAKAPVEERPLVKKENGKKVEATEEEVLEESVDSERDSEKSPFSASYDEEQ